MREPQDLPVHPDPPPAARRGQLDDDGSFPGHASSIVRTGGGRTRTGFWLWFRLRAGFRRSIFAHSFDSSANSVDRTAK
ncbi:hypothetical protein GCM10010422_29630 [Streptomyces graminearus]|uniref:Uncharacterized protein n=1 Tax=Streptomyces graminearus TaxID=284030 RepID=A0ABN3LF41_9ACTN